MGSMDRNTVIGFTFISSYYCFYIYFLSTKSSQELQKQKQAQLDSIARVQRVRDSIRIINDTTSKVIGDTSVVTPAVTGTSIN